jgi:hypothetical protein
MRQACISANKWYTAGERVQESVVLAIFYTLNDMYVYICLCVFSFYVIFHIRASQFTYWWSGVGFSDIFKWFIIMYCALAIWHSVNSISSLWLKMGVVLWIVWKESVSSDFSFWNVVLVHSSWYTMGISWNSWIVVLLYHINLVQQQLKVKLILEWVREALYLGLFVVCLLRYNELSLGFENFRTGSIKERIRMFYNNFYNLNRGCQTLELT